MSVVCEVDKMEKKTATRAELKWRRVTSFFMVFSSIIVVVSGLVLYVTPSGRVARSVDWQVMGLDRWQWDAMHVVFGFAWVLFGVIHVVYNWNAILCYMKKRIQGIQSYRVTVELIIALVLTLVIWFGTLLNLPPFSTIMDIGDTLKGIW